MEHQPPLEPLLSQAGFPVFAAMLVFIVLAATALVILGRRNGRLRGPFAWFGRIDIGPARNAATRENSDPAYNSLDRTGFAPRIVMTTAEQQLFRVMNSILREKGTGHRIIAKCALDTLITPTGGCAQDRIEARHTLSLMRIDFAVIDGQSNPILVVELQCAGLFPDRSAAARRNNRNTLLSRAGVPVLELPRGWTTEILQLQLSEALMRRPRLPGGKLHPLNA